MDRRPSRKSEKETNPLVSLPREINHVFEDFWSKVESGWSRRNEMLGMFGLSIDVTETDTSADISIEFSGMTKGDIDISLTSDAMTIRGKTKTEQEEERKGVNMSKRS